MIRTNIFDRLRAFCRRLTLIAKNQRTLAEIARKDESEYVRKAAAAKLRDNDLLESVINFAHCTEDVAIAAFVRLANQRSNQDALKKVALRCAFAAIRECAVEKLTDEAALAEVAANHGLHGQIADSEVIKAAFHKLSSEDALMKVALTSLSEECRKNDMERLTSESALIQVASKGGRLDTREIALARLTSEVALTRVDMEGVSLNVCMSAAAKISNVSVRNKCALLAAVRLGEIYDVRNALAVAGDINISDCKGNTLIELANEAKNLNVVKFLLKHGAELSEKCLELAIAAQNPEIVEFFLKHGAKPNEKCLERARSHSVGAAIMAGAARFIRRGAELGMLENLQHSPAYRILHILKCFRSPQTPTESSFVSEKLVCGGCAKCYRIQEDAVVVAIEAAYELAQATIVVTDDTTPVREDLVSGLGDSPPENLAAIRERGRSSWEVIKKSLAAGQRRVWRCQACNKVNSYSFR